MTTVSLTSFSQRARSFFEGERALFLALVVMAFCICFNYTLLRNVKEALVVTASGGAAILPFIKVWAMLPCAFLMTALFTYLNSYCRQECLFQGILGGFLFFFLLFLYLLYPSQAELYPQALVEWMKQTLPVGGEGAISMIAHWPLTFFYVLAELWGVMVLSVLFWGLANILISLAEARWLYPLLHISGHCGCMLAGQMPLLLKAQSAGQTLAELIGLVLVTGLATMLLVHALYRTSLGAHNSESQLKAAPALFSLRESLSYIAASSPLRSLAAMVGGYCLLIYTTELFWKDSLQQLYPDFRDYNAYVGRISSYVSVLSILTAVVLPFLLRTCGWKRVALLSPILLGTSSILFCLLFLYVSSSSGSQSLWMGRTALDVLIGVGGLHMTLGLSCKYALFDPTKEMAFIPLNPAYKWTSKAAIDGVGSRLAQSTSSLGMQSAIMLLGSLSACAIYLFPLLFIITAVWIRAVCRLSKQFPELDSPPTSQPVSSS